MDATLASIIAAASPLVFAAVGEAITERSGVINLSLDGSILLSAMAGFAAAYVTGSVVAGFAAGAGVAALVALIVAWSGVTLRLNQIAVGFVLTLLCGSLSAFLGQDFVRLRGPQVSPRPIPVLSDLPFVGRVLFSHNVSVYASMVLVVAAALFLARARRGLELRAVGERPEAAHARGIPVRWYRYAATVVGGSLVGVGGAAFSLDQKAGWAEGLTQGFGWIALAIVIFGGWQPVRVAFGCYLFGALQVLALRLQPVVPGLAQILPSLPFPLMIFALVLVSSRILRAATEPYPRLRRRLVPEPPGALGTNFVLD
ncbi:MAG: ABC transporter permease [Acidimicrobiia bacterium]|jgi:general nucleoside transport system permease protein